MDDLETIAGYFKEEALAHGGSSVRSVVVHGSVLGAEFRPGISDYNFVVLASPIDIGLLDRYAGRFGKWRKKRISPPLLLTPTTVECSLDSYPLEFLSLQARYRVLYGEDFLAGLTFEKINVRLQCERELRSKLLLFRRAYLESEGAPKRLQQLLRRGLPSLAAIFRGMLYFKDGPWKTHGTELWEACERHLGLPGPLLQNLHEVRMQRSVPAREEIRRQLDHVLGVLEGLSQEVDRW
jgi:hypothetical protein